MKELTYEQLSTGQLAQVDPLKITDGQHGLYLANGGEELIGYRAAQMFSSGQPIKWGPPLDLTTGALLPDLPPAKREKKAPASDASAIDATGDNIQWLASGDVLRSDMNPRTDFNVETLANLRASIQELGFDPRISQMLVRPHPTEPGKFEILRGERRWRVATELKLKKVPAFVVEMDDATALEFNLVEQLNSDDLNPIDEAEALCRCLDLRDTKGNPLYTVEKAALRFNRKETHICEARNVRRLRGTKAGQALIDGKIKWMHARALGRIPDGSVRDELAERVVTHELPWPSLESIIRDEVMRELRGLDWKTDDSELVPEMRSDLDKPESRFAGGACDGCSFTFQQSPQSVRMCMNPQCYSLKKAAAHKRWAEGIEASGRKVLEADEAAAMFDGSFPQTKRVRWNSGYVEVEDRPGEHELKTTYEGQPPTWKAMIKGKEVPKFVVKDPNGKEREIVKREQALAAAVAGGHDIFRQGPKADDGAGAKRDDNAIPAVERAASAQKRDEENAKVQRDQMKTGLVFAQVNLALYQAASSLTKYERIFWQLIADPMVECFAESGTLIEVGLAMGLKYPDDGIDLQEVRDDFARALNKGDERALPAIVLLLADRLMASAMPGDDYESWRKDACKLLKVDVKSISKIVETQMRQRDETAALAKEIDEGLAWVTKREKAAEFEWEGFDAINPDVCEVKMPAGVKARVSIFAARAKTGWHASWKIDYGKGHTSESKPLTSHPPDYGTRELAMRTALLEIEKSLHYQALPAAEERVRAYIARIEAPAPSPKKKTAKAAKKGGAK